MGVEKLEVVVWMKISDFFLSLKYNSTALYFTSSMSCEFHSIASMELIMLLINENRRFLNMRQRLGQCFFCFFPQMTRYFL